MSLPQLVDIHRQRRLSQYAYVLRAVLERFEMLPLNVVSFRALFDEQRI